jgi:ATP-dependent protease ClpP protease subunit
MDYNNNIPNANDDMPDDDPYGSMIRPFATNYSQIIDFYLSTEIGDAEKFTNWFHQIRTARESDLVRIHINCCGGDLFTTIQLIETIRESSAKIMGIVEGACMSAATLVFLACDDHAISDHSAFLFHNYSGGVIGKGGEMYSSMVHQRKWSDALLRDSYKNILTNEEIEGLLDDKDVWLNRDEMDERLTKRVKILAAEQEKIIASATAKKTPAKKKAATKKKTNNNN